MSFGSPTFDLIRGEYIAVFTHTNGQEIEVRSRLIPGPDTLDPEDMDEAFADAVAAIDAHADLNFVIAQKEYRTTEGYTL